MEYKVDKIDADGNIHIKVRIKYKESIDLSNIQTFKYDVENAVQDCSKYLRKGQAIADFLYNTYFDAYEKAIKAHKDCFYSDKMIDECITCCYNNIKDSIDVIIYDSDLKGDIKNLPKDIIKKMLVNQVLQGNLINIKIFQENKSANYNKGGFNWYVTNEGYKYWENILVTPSKTIPRIFFKGVPERSAELRNTLINWGVKYIPDNYSFCDTFYII